MVWGRTTHASIHIEIGDEQIMGGTMIKIGSLFSGIGGFELGFERAIPNSKTVWQVEQNKFCQKVLKKHWASSKIFDDVRMVTKNDVEEVDILLGGFPCQDISSAGNKMGIHNGKKSSLWWEMRRIIGELRPRIVCMENVSNILTVGGSDVVGSLTEIGYDCEWTIISAQQFGAPHIRKRWFCVAYPAGARGDGDRKSIIEGKTKSQTWDNSSMFGEFCFGINQPRENSKNRTYWRENDPPIGICGVDDGISDGVDRPQRLMALGNAIVPQCSEWVAKKIMNSGLLGELNEI